MLHIHIHLFKEIRATEKKLCYSGKQLPVPHRRPARRPCPAARKTTPGPTERRRAPCPSAPPQWRWPTWATVPKWQRWGTQERLLSSEALDNQLQHPAFSRKAESQEESHHLTPPFSCAVLEVLQRQIHLAKILLKMVSEIGIFASTCNSKFLLPSEFLRRILSLFEQPVHLRSICSLA